jgi:hypothetical protein
MIDPIERYSKPKPIRNAGMLGALGVMVAGAGLYMIAAAIATTSTHQAVAFVPPPQPVQYASQPAPVRAPAPAPVMAAAPPMAAAGPSTEERYEAARAKIEAVLQQGPFFAGKAYKEGEGESEVSAKIVWDDVSKRASGQINLLTFGNKMDVEGMVAEDRGHGGQFVLRLQARGTDCFYYLAPTASGQLAGTWQWGSGRASGTIDLEPKPAQMVASAETPQPAVQAMVAVQPAPAPAQAPAPAAPSAAPVAVAVPAGTLIETVTMQQIDPTIAGRTWYGKTTGGFDLNNNQTVDPGAVVLMQLVKTGQSVGIHLVGVRIENKIIPVKSDVLPLNVKASNDPVTTQNGNTTTVNFGNFIRGLGNRVAANTPFSFTIGK